MVKKIPVVVIKEIAEVDKIKSPEKNRGRREVGFDR